MRVEVGRHDGFDDHLRERAVVTRVGQQPLLAEDEAALKQGGDRVAPVGDLPLGQRHPVGAVPERVQVPGEAHPHVLVAAHVRLVPVGPEEVGAGRPRVRLAGDLLGQPAAPPVEEGAETGERQRADVEGPRRLRQPHVGGLPDDGAPFGRPERLRGQRGRVVEGRGVGGVEVARPDGPDDALGLVGVVQPGEGAVAVLGPDR